MRENEDDNVSMTIRYTIEFTKADHAALVAISKQFKITQAEAMGVLIKNANVEQLAPQFEEIRNAKLKERDKKRKIISKFKALTPEQRAAIEALAVESL